MKPILIITIITMLFGCTTMNSSSYDLGPRTEIVINYNYAPSGFGPGNDSNQNSSPKTDTIKQTNTEEKNQTKSKNTHHELIVAPLPKMKLNNHS
ncbi:hypothetical protein [Neisseria sp. Ec49-e6-T10]|uniref:hypothetical protein n=1 Tax=Neisseria sp. Ec49-e6-T10 TaxID=3140744 RepID=UPI003EB9E493